MYAMVIGKTEKKKEQFGSRFSVHYGIIVDTIASLTIVQSLEDATTCHRSTLVCESRILGRISFLPRDAAL